LSDRATMQRVRTEATDLERRLGVKAQLQNNEAADAGALLALAYPDRIAQRRGSARGKFLLRNGRGAVLDPASPLAAADYIVAAQVDDRGADTRVFLAGELSFEGLTELFADQIETIRSVEWNRASRRITARERQQLGAIVLKERPFEPEQEEVTAAVLAAIRREGIDILPWSRAAQQLRARLAFLHAIDNEWPAVSDQSLLDHLESWLSPLLGASPQLDRLDVVSALHALLTWQQRAALDEWAPTHIITPSGSNLPLDYSDPAAPMLPVRLQEVFGWQQTPRIAGGRVPITMQLLSPASRPVQITRDLASFWKTTYFDVKKDLKGRYPKHYWPDDPASATPTRRVRPKSTDQG
jgi:ATP-dependent helicase HrpB